MATRVRLSRNIVVHQSTGRHTFQQQLRFHQTASSEAPGGADGHWGQSGSNEVQRVELTGSPGGGTFTLTYSGQTTAGIAFNADAATVQAALVALSNIAVGEVSVTPAVVGGVLPTSAMFVEFTGALALTNVAQMTGSGASLTGGSTPAVSITTIQVGSASGTTIRALGTNDDHLATVNQEAESIAVGNIAGEAPAKVGSLVFTGVVVVPSGPEGDEENTRPLWRKNTFSSRIPGLSQA